MGPRYFYLWQAYFWWPMWPSEFASCLDYSWQKWEWQVVMRSLKQLHELTDLERFDQNQPQRCSAGRHCNSSLQRRTRWCFLIRVTFFLRWEHRLRFAATVSRSQMHRTYFSCLWFDDAISWRCLAAPCVGVWLWALRVVASVALIWWSCRGLSGLSSLSGLSAGVIYPLLI